MVFSRGGRERGSIDRGKEVVYLIAAILEGFLKKNGGGLLMLIYGGLIWPNGARLMHISKESYIIL